MVVNKIIEAEDVNWGYDAMEGTYVNMIEAGIIDPTKVSCKIVHGLVLMQDFRLKLRFGIARRKYIYFLYLGCENCPE